MNARHINRKWWITILIISIVAISGYFLFHKSPTIPDTATVTEGNIDEQVVASGQIIPRHVIQVKSQISGDVDKILVKEGDFVKANQVLLTINPNPTPTIYAQAIANVDQDKAKFNSASATYQRDVNLIKTGAITQSTLDQDQSAYLVAKSQLQLDEANLSLITQGSADIANEKIESNVKSPIDGYILSKIIDSGDSVVPVTQYQAGTPLFVIANMEDLIFEGQVSQIDVGKLHIKMLTDIQIAALPDLKLSGDIETISLQTAQQESADQQAASVSAGSASSFQPQSTIQNGFNVTISGFKLPEKTILRAGYQATATITIKQINNVLILPQSTIQYDGSQAYVMLFTGKNNKKQNVTLGSSDAVNVQIQSGLNLGDKVLLNPNDNDSQQ